MARMSIGFGVVLILLGVWGFVATGSAHPTALIPVWFGLALGVCGALATTEDAQRRMLWMHVAVTTGLLGFLGAAIRAIIEFVGAHGAPLAHPIAVEDQAAMATVCAIYEVLCVRSFIAARRSRKSEAQK
jgi:fucose 4-O-acetylase-like acetyltransferase